MRSTRAPLAGLIVLVALVIVGARLGGPGLWEPQELNDARETMNAVQVRTSLAQGRLCADDDKACEKERSEAGLAPTKDIVHHRSDEKPALSAQWRADVIDSFGPSEAAARLPNWIGFVLGLLGVFLLAYHLGGLWSALASSIVFASLPLVVMGSRSVVGDSLGVGAVTLTLAALAYWVVPSQSRRSPVIASVYTAAGGLGLVIGVAAVGALLGAFVPLATAAAASYAAAGRRPSWLPILLTVVAVAVLASILADVFVVQTRIPGTRELFSQSFRVAGGSSLDLGGQWHEADTPGVYFSAARSTPHVFYLIAFGLFPWTLLLPVAVLATARRNTLLVFALFGYVAAAIFLTEKVTPTAFYGAGVCAVILGLWLVQFARTNNPIETASRLAALLVLVTALVLTKDALADPGRIFFAHLATATLKFPEGLTLLKLFVALFGLLFCVFFTIGLAMPRTWLTRKPFSFVLGRRPARARTTLVLVALSLGLAWSFFLAHVAQPQLSARLSSKGLYNKFEEVARDSDRLFVVGNIGYGPDYYVPGRYRRLGDRRALIQEFAKPQRTFAVARAQELCPLLREAKGAPVYALYYAENATELAKNQSKVLLANQLPNGERDLNPVIDYFSKEAPKNVGKQVYVRFKDGLELVGVDVPSAVDSGDTFTVRLTFHVYGKVQRGWKMFNHIVPIGGGTPVNADRAPMRGRCQTNYWPKDHYMVESFSVSAPGAAGNYKFLTGFFFGSSGRFTNADIDFSQPTRGVAIERDAPGKPKNKVNIGAIQVR